MTIKTANHYKLCSESIVYEREDEDESTADIKNTVEATNEYMVGSAMRYFSLRNNKIERVFNFR